MRRALATGRRAWLAALLALPLSAAAQAPDSVALDTLRVDVARTSTTLRLVPAAVSTVGAADIGTARPGIGLDEALAAVPGVHIANRENLALGSRVTMRGFGARAAFGVRGVRIVMDDVPLTTADGQSSLNNIDLVRAGRIEVLRGPASALYGNAAGGVIRIESAPPPSAAEVRARVTVGNEARGSLGALFRTDAQAAGPLGSGGYRVGVSHLTRNGVREHAAAEQNTLNAQLVHALAPRTALRFVLNAADTPEAQNPGSLPADSARRDPEMAWPNNVRTASGESVRQVQGGVTLEHRGRATRAHFTTWGAHRALENPIPVAFIELDRSAGGARAQVDGTAALLSWTAGIELELQRDARYEWTNDGGERGAEQRRDQRDRVFALGPYVRAAAQLGRLHVSAGARWDRIAFETDDRLLSDGDGSGRRVLSAFSPSLGILLEATPRLSIFASVSRAFQTPTTTELANSPPAPGEPCCPTGFNDVLEPERTWGGEVGLRGTPAPWLNVDAAAFAYLIDDAIVPLQVEGIEERSFFRNAGRTRHRGFELATTLLPLPQLRLRAAFTALDVRFQDDGDPFTSFEGHEVPGIAPLRVYGDFRWRGPVTLELDLEHTGGYYADDANSPAAFAEAATIVGARAHLTLALHSLRIEPFVSVRNLTAERYTGAVSINAFGGRFFEPAAGRMLLLGASIEARP